jgi:catechol 2,3-dioxygenase-like lactoylglutathione lyase family enzyme
MPDDEFRVDGIDHVELSVPDRYEAAEWYHEALGFEIVEEFEHWARLSAYPLMLSTDGGRTMLALFEGPPSPGTGGFRRVAFRTSGKGFLAFLDRTDAIPEIDAQGAGSVTDFGSAYSVFFSDPYGYPFEVTTYEYDVVSESLK